MSIAKRNLRRKNSHGCYRSAGHVVKIRYIQQVRIRAVRSLSDPHVVQHDPPKAGWGDLAQQACDGPLQCGVGAEQRPMGTAFWKVRPACMRSCQLDAVIGTRFASLVLLYDLTSFRAV